MSKHRSSRHPPSQPSSGVGVRRTTDGHGWVLVHPRCARDRSEDLEEVRAMMAAGEFEIATDELRWLLSGCSESIEAHALLGESALASSNDLPLARGHFGAAYQLGITALRGAGMPSPLPYAHPANKAFFEAGRGLAWCLARLQQLPLAEEIIDQLRKLDPADPLRLGGMLDELRTGGLPIIDLRPTGEDAAGEPPPVG